MSEHPEDAEVSNIQTEAPRTYCGECPHRRSLLEAGRCKPGDTCVQAMSGRQIERFFRTNPGLARDYAGDELWERRAIAARYLSQKMLLSLLDDPEEVVRRVLAYRLPVDALGPLIRDPDREVRITVAAQFPAHGLTALSLILVLIGSRTYADVIGGTSSRPVQGKADGVSRRTVSPHSA